MFFQYAFAQGPSTCGDFGIDCSGSVKRLGVQGIYRCCMPGVFVPWFGAGLGYEWMTASVGTLDVAFHGFEFLNLQLGGEFRVSPQVGLGPYLGLSVARYDGGSTSLGGERTSTSTTRRSTSGSRSGSARGSVSSRRRAAFSTRLRSL